MTLIFTNNTKNQFLVMLLLFLYFQDINALDKKISYEFEYVFSHLLRLDCFRGTLVYEVHPPVRRSSAAPALQERSDRYPSENGVRTTSSRMG